MTKEWSAVWGNDPDDDYNLVLEMYYDDKEKTVVKQSQQGLILQWYFSPKGLIIPVDWLLDILSGAKEGIVDPTTVIGVIEISHWTSNFANNPNSNNNPVVTIFCDDEDVATIKQSQQGLILEWYADPKGLSLPVDWLSNLLLQAKDVTGDDGSLS